MEKRENISMSIIKRLPRYYRFLQSLKDNGIVRISSKELADRMGLTASQIRHDFNSFGDLASRVTATMCRSCKSELAKFCVWIKN